MPLDPYAPGVNEVTENYFATEEEALAEIATMGWFQSVRDVVTSGDEDLHWHDFEAITFVVSGAIRVADENGATFEVGPGARIRTGPGFLHRELNGGRYRVAQGFRMDPATFTQPINKHPSLLKR